MPLRETIRGLARSPRAWAIFTALVLLAAGVITISAGSDDVVIPPWTKVLDEEALAALIDVDDEYTLTFSGGSDIVSDLEEEDIVVAGVSESTPTGLLRRVEDIERTGDTTVVRTREAALSEAIERGSLEYEAPLPLDQIEESEIAGESSDERASGSAAPAPGKLVLASATQEQDDPRRRRREERTDRTDLDEPINVDVDINDQGMTLAIRDLVVYDIDGDRDTTDDQTTIEGSLGFDLGLFLDLEIEDFEVEYFAFGFEGKQTAQVIVNARAAARFEEEVEIASFRFPRVTILIGPVPVVVTPRLVILLRADGSITAAMTTSATEKASVKVGAEYRDDRWEEIKEADFDVDFQPPAFGDDDKAEVRVRGGPRLELLAYDAVGPYVGVDGFVRLEAFARDPYLCLYAGLLGNGGFTLRFLSEKVSESEEELFKLETLLYPDSCEPGATAAGGRVEPVPSFSITLGACRDEVPGALIPLSDGGVLFGGKASIDALLFRLNAAGDVTWEKVFPNLGTPSSIVGLIERPDGFLAFVQNGWHMELNSDGDLEKLIRYSTEGPRGEDRFHLVLENAVPHPDGDGFLAIGDTVSTPVAVRIGADGSIRWARAYDTGDGSVRAASFSDGGWQLFVSRQHLLLRVAESDGSVLSSQRLSLSEASDLEDFGLAVGPTPDGGLVVSLWSTSRSRSAIVRLEPEGRVRWARWQELSDAQERSEGRPLWRTAMELAGGDVVVAGSVRTNRDQDAVIQRVDSKGELTWAVSYGGPHDDRAGSFWFEPQTGLPIAATTDGGIVVAGNSNSFPPVDHCGEDGLDVWILKIPPTGLMEFSDNSEGTRSNRTYSSRPTTVDLQPVETTSREIDVRIVEHDSASEISRNANTWHAYQAS